MKRKLDDVAKRLESLYDLLRDNRVSSGHFLLQFILDLFHFSSFAVDAQHFSAIKSNGAMHSNRGLRERPGIAHANVLWPGLCAIGQFYARY